MIPARLFLRTLPTKPPPVPIGIHILQRHKGSLAKLRGSSVLIAAAENPGTNQYKHKKERIVIEGKKQKEETVKEKKKQKNKETVKGEKKKQKNEETVKEGKKEQKSKKIVEEKKKVTKSNPTAAEPVVKKPKQTTTKKTEKVTKKVTNEKSKGSRHEIKPPEVVKEPTTAQPERKAITLRDYQQECIDAVLDHVKEGHKRLAISLATGSGKTVIFTQLIDKLPPPNEKATQTLILVHRKELLEQAYNHSTHAYPEKTVEVEMAHKVASGVADITLASIQSIVSKDRIEKFDPGRFKLILIDECHHAVSSTYMQALDHFGALHPEKNGGEHPVVVGVSATLSRSDGLRMGAILDYIVYHKDYLDMIRDSWLSNVHFTTVQTHVDLSAVRHTSGDFNTADLSLAVNTTQTNEITVRAWLEKASERKSTLVFCVDIAHVVDMANTFRKFGIDARFVTSLTAREERTKCLQGFKNGDFKVLVNCGILTEGTDIPNIDCVLLARPTRSKNLLIQMIGRGMRLSPDKKNCHIIDMIGVLNKGIITTPSLFGLDPFTIVDKVTPDKMETMLKDQEEEGPRKQFRPEIIQPGELSPPNAINNLRNIPIKHITFTDYDTIWDLLSDTTHDKYIRQQSQFAWVMVGPSEFVLSASGKVLRIEKQEDGTYSVLEKSLLRLAEQFMTSTRTIASGIESLAHAISGADTYASGNMVRQMILQSAPWRKTPVSAAQMEGLKKFKPEKDWSKENLTKGQAADLLTRMRYGYGKFGKALKQAKKAQETESKLLEAKQRREIKVGKLL